MKGKTRIRPMYGLIVLALATWWWKIVQSVPTIRNGADNNKQRRDHPYRRATAASSAATDPDSKPATPLPPSVVILEEEEHHTIPTKSAVLKKHDSNSSINASFLSWCHSVLGIETSLLIKAFDYYDYMQAHMLQDDEGEADYEFCETPTDDISVDKLPMLSVRGLAASRDISVGEVVISIPFNAMISVPTTIDHDPVLSRVLGPQARAQHGWDDSYFEMPLLTVALLYHKRLGVESPMHHYLELLEHETSNKDAMPSLWSKRKLRQEATDGVRRIARGIQRDIQEMYQTVVTVLVEDHPDIFGKTEDWAYSYANFQWAFAMVNSRHWNLPIPDLDLVVVDLDPSTQDDKSKGPKAAPVGNVAAAPALGEQVPPAEQPTESWVREQEEIENREGVEINEPTAQRSHSFLAPVADLLNFGPPCTRGNYNTKTKAFELVATCPFRKGQEVTYWYSDDCDDVIIANYGFTHPMVPKCPSVEDWRQQTEAWQHRAELLEAELQQAYEELDQVDEELDQLHNLIDKCDCDDDETERPKPRTEGSRKQNLKLRHKANNGQTDHERGHIRRKWPNKKSDLGL